MACMFFVYPKRLPDVEPQTNNLANLATGVKNITFILCYQLQNVNVKNEIFILRYGLKNVNIFF